MRLNRTHEMWMKESTLFVPIIDQMIYYVLTF